MKTKLLIVLALFTFTVSPTHAQRNLKGYYVSTQGDTTRGVFVTYKGWDKSPKQVRFKKVQGKEILLSPVDVKTFQAEGQYKYLSFEGYRHLNNKDPLNDTMKVNAFLKMIFEWGSTRLFELKDSLRSNIYLQKDQVLTELLYTQRIENGEYKVNDSFKKQISSLFEKELAERQLTNDLASLEYTDQSLVNFFKTLLGSSEVKIKKLYKPEIFIAPGVSINRFHAFIGDYLHRHEGNFNVSTTPLFSAGIQFYDQKTAGRVFYAASLSAYSFSNQAQYPQGSTGTTTIKYEGSTISPCLHVGYNLLYAKTIQFYFQAGCGIMYFTKAQKTESFETSWGTTPSLPEVTKFNYTANLNLNLQVGFTLYKRVSVWGSYLVPMSMYRDDSEVSQHMPLELGIKYFVKRKY